MPWLKESTLKDKLDMQHNINASVSEEDDYILNMHTC